MKSIEEMKAEQAKAIAKLEKEHALAALCPVPPKSVQITSGDLGHWISYEAESLHEAIDLMAKFQPITFYEYKKTFTRFVPEPLNVGKDAGEEKSGPYVVKLDVSQGEGFGPSVYMAFFFYAGADICMARVSLRKGYNDRFGQYGARFQANDRGQSRTNDGRRFIYGDFVSNGNLSGLFDKVTKWGTGSQEGAHYSYAMMADDYVAGTDEARLRLCNAANVMHGEREESAA